MDAFARSKGGSTQSEGCSQLGSAQSPPTSSSSSSQSLKEARVLSELTASVHTLQSISEVLDDIAAAVGRNIGDNNNNNNNNNSSVGGIISTQESVADKQTRLLDELRKWGKFSD